jgi:hypothetical protein
MDIHKLRITPEKLDRLSQAELEYVIQLIDEHTTNYSYAARNYPPERHEKYSVPYLKLWSAFKLKVLAKV